MSEYIIMHHQRKGARWGVLNGPPYPLDDKGMKSFKRNAKAGDGIKGKAKRAGQKIKGGAEKVAPAFERNIKTKNGKTSMAEQTVGNVQKIGRGVNDIREINSQEGARHQQEAKKMSDKDLQKAINRMRLEQQYADLSQKDVSKGSDRVERYMNTALVALEITGAAVGIAAGVQTLRQNSKK